MTNPRWTILEIRKSSGMTWYRVDTGDGDPMVCVEGLPGLWAWEDGVLLSSIEKGAMSIAGFRYRVANENPWEVTP